VRARARTALAVTPALALAATTVAACAGAPGGAGDGRAVVVAAVDGDTVDVRIAGRRERVRLLGIDTPETKHPTKPVECYGPEAAARLAALLPRGTRITLTRDAEARDDFGRLLAYVHRGDAFVNLVLVEEGYAATLDIEPNSTYRQVLASAAATARSEGRGRWSACPGR
jgi:micrococcal nuclease